MSYNTPYRNDEKIYTLQVFFFYHCGFIVNFLCYLCHSNGEDILHSSGF